MPGFSNILDERRIATPLICAISDRRAFPDLSEERYVRLFMGCSAPVLQLREKQLDRRQLRPLLSAAVQLRRAGQVLLVNSELALGLELGADGCHLTSKQDLGLAVRRRSQQRREHDFLLGQSVHSLSEALRAESEGADYVIFGPVFEPLSKVSSSRPAGVSGLREVAQALFIPVIAVGGISRGNLSTVFSTGVAGAAGISLIIEELRTVVGGSK